MIKGFKEFTMKKHVLDLEVGIIIGAAFGKLVASFVSIVLMLSILGKELLSNE